MKEQQKPFEALMDGVRATTKEEKAAILNRFYKLWKKYPDLRFGQLIGNIIREEQRLYYIEDYALIETLEDSYDRLEKV